MLEVRSVPPQGSSEGVCQGTVLAGCVRGAVSPGALCPREPWLCEGCCTPGALCLMLALKEVLYPQVWDSPGLHEVMYLLREQGGVRLVPGS